jgi:D-ribose pyranase
MRLQPLKLEAKNDFWRLRHMLKSGILNPKINSLLTLVRHTNTLVIADRGFPFWKEVETIDISLVDDMPRVLDVLAAIRKNFSVVRAFMAEEFSEVNSPETILQFRRALDGVALEFEPHVDFKKRVPHAIGIIRTGDTIPYANLVLESG